MFILIYYIIDNQNSIDLIWVSYNIIYSINLSQGS